MLTLHRQQGKKFKESKVFLACSGDLQNRQKFFPIFFEGLFET
jgi:hypothetical protein